MKIGRFAFALAMGGVIGLPAVAQDMSRDAAPYRASVRDNYYEYYAEEAPPEASPSDVPPAPPDVPAAAADSAVKVDDSGVKEWSGKGDCCGTRELR